MRILLFVFWMCSSILSTAQTYTLIKNARIALVDEMRWSKELEILLLGDRIVAMDNHVTVPGNVPVHIVDVKGKYLVPGMTDAHIHFFQSGGLFARPDAWNLKAIQPYEKEIAWNLQHAESQLRRYLACGVIGVMDCGGPFSNFDIRSRFSGSSLLPHISVTGPLISTWQPPNLDTLDPPIIRAELEELSSLIQAQRSSNPDFIKVWFIVRPGEDAENYRIWLRTVKKECDQLKLPLAVHATEFKTAQLAVEEGANILVHSVFDTLVDAEFARLLKKKQVIYIPTLCVKEGYEESFGNKHNFNELEFKYGDPYIISTLLNAVEIPDSLATPRVKRMRSAEHEVHLPEIALKNLIFLNRAGVKIATGTDAGNIGTLHGPAIFREMEMMKASGMTDWEIIRSSTAYSADVAGFKQSGRIEKGKEATFLILDSDPSADYRNMFQWEYAFVRGNYVQRDTIVHVSAAEVVQKQLNAYNARNTEAFMDNFDHDCILYDLKTGNILMQGHEAMEKRYGHMFKIMPQLHCRLNHRIVHGNMIIDEEFVQGLGPDEVHATAIYEVEDGKIIRCWFVR